MSEPVDASEAIREWLSARPEESVEFAIDVLTCLWTEDGTTILGEDDEFQSGADFIELVTCVMPHGFEDLLVKLRALREAEEPDEDEDEEE